MCTILVLIFVSLCKEKMTTSIDFRHIEDVSETEKKFFRPVPEKLRMDRDTFFVISITPSEQGACAICVFGTRRTLEEANEYAAELSRDNDALDYFVAPCHDWLVVPPNKTQIENQKFPNAQLDSIFSSWKKKIKGDAESIQSRLQEADERKTLNLPTIEDGPEEV